MYPSLFCMVWGVTRPQVMGTIVDSYVSQCNTHLLSMALETQKWVKPRYDWSPCHPLSPLQAGKSQTPRGKRGGEDLVETWAWAFSNRIHKSAGMPCSTLNTVQRDEDHRLGWVGLKQAKRWARPAFAIQSVKLLHCRAFSEATQQQGQALQHKASPILSKQQTSQS